MAEITVNGRRYPLVAGTTTPDEADVIWDYTRTVLGSDPRPGRVSHPGLTAALIHILVAPRRNRESARDPGDRRL